jgi:Na+-translocating ferredoxin:NAD+ oxidoreductase RnfC subunit
MMNLQGMLIAGGVAALVAGGIGLQVGKGLEKGACERRIEILEKAAAKLIDQKDAEILVLSAEKAQAQAEVTKVNAETLRQFNELQVLLTADQAKRDEAAIRVEAAAKQAAVNARDAAAKAQAAREIIQNVADQCARAGVPDDVVRVLNDILGAP